MLSRCGVRLLAVGLFVALGALGDPALYWGSQTALSGDFAAGPDLVGPDGVPAPSGGNWLVQLVDLGSGAVLAAAPAGALMDIGQGAAAGVLYATLPEAGPWRGYAVGTRVFNADSVAAATHWAMLSATTVLSWDTVPSAPATFTYNAGHVAQGDWRIVGSPLYTLTYLAGADGTIDGPTPQTCSYGSDGAAVTAVPAFGHHFEGWSDGSTANPRQDLQVTASQTLAALFGVSGPVSPNGSFLARVSTADGAAQRLWDLSGTYATTVAGQPLVMSLVHDPMGRLSGTATYALGKASAISLSVRGTVKGSSAGGVTLKGFLAGANPERTVSVALALRLTVDAALGQLVGPISGRVVSNGISTAVAADLALPIAAPMDGTWTLRLQLERAGRVVTGTARLSLANGVGYAYVVGGKVVGQRTLLSLAGDPADPLSKAVRIRALITPLEGDWARLERLAGSGYGQTLVW